MQNGDNMTCVKTTITDILNQTVFCQVANTLNDCSPYMLVHFWMICRVLQGILPQLGYSKAELPVATAV
jgi:hypothetical protein